jgi:uncharacterized protein YndB with AHSA1/START domain
MSNVDPEHNPYGERQMWRVVIHAPIESVWNTLVKTDEVLPFLFGAVCETEAGLRPGEPMRMVTRNRKRVMVFGEVLEFSPPHRFSHTITFTQVQGERPARTTYELKAVEGGTELTLISDSVPGTQIGKMVKGGPFIVENLKAIVETGRPTFGGSLVMLMSPLMSMFAPPRTRVRNWPLTRERIEAMNRGT